MAFYKRKQYAHCKLKNTAKVNRDLLVTNSLICDYKWIYFIISSNDIGSEVKRTA